MLLGSYDEGLCKRNFWEMSASTARNGLKYWKPQEPMYFMLFSAVEVPISQQFLLHSPSSYDLRNMKSAGAKKILNNLPPSYWSSSRGPGRHQPAPHCWHLRALVKLPRSVPVESLYESEHILPGKKYWEFFDCVGMIGFYIDAEVEICGIF